MIAIAKKASRVNATSILLGLFAFILAVAYWPYIYAPATSTKWAYLAIVLPIFLFFYYEKRVFTSIHLLGLSFIIWSAFSVFWSANVLDGFNFLFELGIAAQAFVLGTYLKDLKPVFVGLALGLIAQSVLLFGPATQFMHPALFVNGNIFSEVAFIVAVGIIVCGYRYWWMAVALLPAILINNTRSVIVAGIGTFAVWLWTKSKLLASCLLSLCALALLVTYYLGYKPDSVNFRLTWWKEILPTITLFGHGSGSFQTLFPFYTDSFDTIVLKLKYPHNDLIQIAFEQGILGAIIAVTLCWLVMRTNQNERYVFIAFMGISCFAFPFYLPTTAFIAALVCGYLARDRAEFRVALDDSRSALREWGAKYGGFGLQPARISKGRK